ncbi:type VI secretion system baseplate subunit TssG [Salipiger sp. 1_MG-2023]|uniref:type VI secretion system baseplate subunit TssG n=1 Tax=Salipiger sp. 1_MG-2023 TaxID=3062665 RepID=UPI0026E14213|nr:type VI secretion system baseplate subunit TssG [Salipiger sp. 1_MG-2023]MDO6584919.1 type VI secretion system baseplate subunit TssG [Salipiger sp. 1_MG-2023]
MADDSRHPRADLSAEAIAEMDVFELLRRLETDAARFGRSGPDPARLGQLARQSFATSDVASLTPASAERPAQVAINVLGLIGPEGPLPLHMTRWIIQRLSNRWFDGAGQGASADTAFLDFANLLQHRLIALYWRAWADARPEIHIAHGDGERITAMLRALAGIGLPGETTSDARLDGAKLHHATSLAQEVRGPQRLTRFLETVLGLPVDVVEWAGHWTALPERLQTRLGGQHCGLGSGAVAGARIFDRQSRAELRLGPLTLAQFHDFLNDPEAWARLRHAVLSAMGREIAFDLRLVLHAEDVPPAQLGGCQLGRTAWLSPLPGRDADDLCFAAITEERQAA